MLVTENENIVDLKKAVLTTWNIHESCTKRNNFFVYFSSVSFVCHDFQLNFSSISLLDGMLNETYWGLSHSELNWREVLTKTAYIECITLGTGWASAKPQTFFWLVSFSPLPYLWVLNLILNVWVPYLRTCWEVHLIDAVLFVLFINILCCIYLKDGTFLALVDQCSLDMQKVVRYAGFFPLKKHFKPLFKTEIKIVNISAKKGLLCFSLYSL